MNSNHSFPIGTCTYGPVVLSASIEEENKHSISIIEYDGTRHINLVTCKTTSKGHNDLWPGEFIIEDLFGRGPTKVRPYNIIRIRKPRINAHTHLGTIAQDVLPQFELGLRIAVKKRELDPKEILDLADSWQDLFSV